MSKKQLPLDMAKAAQQSAIELLAKQNAAKDPHKQLAEQLNKLNGQKR